MFIKDLSTKGYFASGDFVRAVGWLEGGRPYRQGSVTAEFLAQLKQHVANAFQPVLFMGFHPCGLCAPGSRNAGYRNLLVPTERLLYVAPVLVVHYIEDHGYQPPEEFIAAVMACPEQKSVGYTALLKPFERAWRVDE